MSLNVLQTADM